jgi:hypothetical protein
MKWKSTIVIIAEYYMIWKILVQFVEKWQRTKFGLKYKIMKAQTKITPNLRVLFSMLEKLLIVEHSKVFSLLKYRWICYVESVVIYHNKGWLLCIYLHFGWMVKRPL